MIIKKTIEEFEESEVEDEANGGKARKADGDTLTRLFHDLAAEQGITVLGDIEASASGFAGQLTEAQARLVIGKVFTRLNRDRTTDVRSFAVVRKTWEASLAFADRPLDELQAWLGGHEHNFERFCALYPAHGSDNVRSDATRRAFIEALNRGADAEQLLEAVRRYGASLDGRRARRAAAWLADGEWRESAKAQPVAAPVEGDTPWARIRSRAEQLPNGLANLLGNCSLDFTQGADFAVVRSARPFVVDRLRRHQEELTVIVRAELGVTRIQVEGDAR